MGRTEEDPEGCLKLPTYSGIATSNTIVKMRCPSCRQNGTFDELHGINDVRIQPSGTIAGLRICPNPDCHNHVYVEVRGGKVAASFPAERIDFDSTNIPAAILRTFEEAVTCHASRCFIAAAIMVRKTLEELCKERGATGNNLKERLQSLSSKIVLPAELLDGLQDLRLLGNDAAHLESQVFDAVGENEVEIGIEFAKEVLKAVYQYTALLAKLRGLKKSP